MAIGTFGEHPGRLKFTGTCVTPEPRRDNLNEQLGALCRRAVGEGLEGELQRVGHHAAEGADAQADGMHPVGPGLPGLFEYLIQSALHDG